MCNPAEELNIEDPTPSTVCVYAVIRLADGWLSVSEVVDRSGFSLPTVLKAADMLLDAGAIEEQYGVDGDGRERHFRATT